MAIVRVDVRPELLQWACDRAGDTGAGLRERDPRIDEWMRGESQPTLKQIEDFARAVRVPLGYLFLPKPPKEKLPIRDLRTVGSKGVCAPSPDLLDVIYLCQRRQEWYREYAEGIDEDPKAFVGSAAITQPPTDVAAAMRRKIDFGIEARRLSADTDAAMRLFVEKTEESGVLVMISGVVKNSTNRPLDPEEFRGFALADKMAPLVFVNAVDSKPAQMFTLAHELAHIWLGESALSDISIGGAAHNRIEKWCNHVAAEFLVPLAELQAMSDEDPLSHIDTYRQTFKVGRLVVLRRLFDAKMISQRQFDSAYAVAISQFAKKPRENSGGDFYNTVPARASKRFIRALVASTSEGTTLYREAFQMLGVNSIKAFTGIGRKVGALQ